MRKPLIITCAALALIAAGLAQARPGDRLPARFGQQNAASTAPEAPGKQSPSYGSDALQNLDCWPAQKT